MKAYRGVEKFSIVIPVLHEAREINALIRHIKTTGNARDCEIIIVDGSQEGDTLQAIIDNDVCRVSSSKGRARQMNAGAEAATGEVLIFLHADTRLPAGALSFIDRIMVQEGIVGGAFDLAIQSNRWVFKLIAAMASLRSRLTRIPYGDQAIFIRRAYFYKIGGYPEMPLMEDVALMIRIKKEKGRIGFIAEPVLTSPRRWEKEGILYTTLRNWALIVAYFLGASPETLSRYYKSEERT